ncbi:hypothetical protein PENTCL1PPCAC_13084, partial [Pristionchus entomophagus]
RHRVVEVGNDQQFLGATCDHLRDLRERPIGIRHLNLVLLQGGSDGFRNLCVGATVDSGIGIRLRGRRKDDLSEWACCVGSHRLID